MQMKDSCKGIIRRDKNKDFMVGIKGVNKNHMVISKIQKTWILTQRIKRLINRILNFITNNNNNTIIKNTKFRMKPKAKKVFLKTKKREYRIILNTTLWNTQIINLRLILKPKNIIQMRKRTIIYSNQFSKNIHI